MRQPFPKKVKPGDTIKADDWNCLIELICRNSIEVDASSGLEMKQSPSGTSIRIANNDGSGSFLCVTDGTISACGAFSGSTATAGSGTVFICQTSGTTITKTSETLSVLNFSTTTGGIASGVNVWVSQDDNGNYYITSVDCGN